MHTESSIMIKGSLDEVFSVVWDVEKYSEFIPQFKETKILKQEEDKIVIERKIRIGWLHSNWQSEMTTEKNRWIKFVHLSGFLRGMKTEWIFEEIKEGVEIRVFHNFEIKIPVVDQVIALVLWNVFIKRTAETMLKRIKERIERGR